MLKVRDLILVAMFAALTGVGAFIKIPIPYVPITLQFLFCAFSGIILGSKLGALSQIVYVAIGLAGVPVFADGGGIGYILRPTFGYLIGFILAAYIIGRLTERTKEITLFKSLLTVLSGLFLIYLPGVMYLYIICNLYLGQNKSIYWVIFYGFLTSIGGDLVLSFVIAAAANRIIKIIRKQNYVDINRNIQKI